MNEQKNAPEAEDAQPWQPPYMVFIVIAVVFAVVFAANTLFAN